VKLHVKFFSKEMKGWDSMQDRNIVITGGTDGMGKATAHQLAKLGARLLLVSRNRDKGEAAAAEIVRSSGNEAITFLAADLSLVREMQRTAAHIRQTFNRLDVLVHAAGGLFPGRRTLTDEGLELSFAIQYLARFVLTNELLDLLNAAPAPQVLSIAGGAWGSKQVDLDDLHSERSYGKFKAIRKTAALNYLLTLGQLARYQDVTFYNYGPGLVRTATVTENMAIMRLLMNTVGRLFSRSPEEAANDIVALLTGEYSAGFYGVSLKQNEPPTAAESDAALSEKLWDYSEKLVESLLSEQQEMY
jgi:NAD(P)-dependent dehydrogenase (short-subunit alcohol dehydrogenase family)